MIDKKPSIMTRRELESEVDELRRIVAHGYAAAYEDGLRTQRRRVGLAVSAYWRIHKALITVSEKLAEGLLKDAGQVVQHAIENDREIGISQNRDEVL
jgi:hypothetical protein